MIAPTVSAATVSTDRSAMPRTVARPALFIGVLAAALSAIGSWSVSLWTDEAATISAAERGLPQLFTLVGHIDAVHGTYYLLMHFWIGAFGASPFSLRLPSALVTGAAASGTVVLGARLVDRRLGVIAGLVFCALPRVTWMGIEARSFASSAAVAVWLTVALVSALRGRRGMWIAYAILGALGVALNIYVALVFAAHAVTVLIVRVTWRQRISWLIAAVIATAVASPVVYESLRQKGQLQQPALGVVYFIRSAVVNDWFLGATPTPNSARTGTSALIGGGGVGLWQVSSVGLAVLAWLLIVAGVVRSRRLARPANEAYIPVSALILPWMLLPVIVVGAYSFVSTPIFNPRYFTFAVAPVAIGVGCGIAVLGIRLLRVVAGGLIVVLAAPVYFSQRGEFAKSSTDWSAAAAYIDAHKSADEGVYFSPTAVPAADARTVSSTMRRVAIAYPNDFRGLTDVTAAQSPVASNSLFGESVPLDDVTSELTSLRAVWVVRPRTYPAAGTSADADILTRAGLHPALHWSGPTDTVVEWTRGENS